VSAGGALGALLYAGDRAEGGDMELSRCPAGGS
jgi:hypothetical protein